VLGFACAVPPEQHGRGDQARSQLLMQ
jgi:hypothetical protein